MSDKLGVMNDERGFKYIMKSSNMALIKLLISIKIP